MADGSVDANVHHDAATDDDASVDGGDPEDGGVVTGCPAFNPSNASHRPYGQETSTTIITADETWTSDNVYFVISLLEIRAATLTIEAGTRVCLTAGAGSPPTITVFGQGGVEGRVVINGTASEPVVFDRAGTDETYSGFYFSGPSYARFDHVIFNHGGVGGLGVLRFAQNHGHPAVLRNVSIRNFYKMGLSLQNPDGLTSDSTVFLDSQMSTSTDPIVVTSLVAANTLNATNLRIAETIPHFSRVIRFIDHDLRTDLTLSGSIGADYLMQTGDLNVRRSDSLSPIPTLTLEAGARLRFGDGELRVGFVGSGNEGSLVVNGTTEAPAVMTSAAFQTPANGQWNGVTLYAGASPNSALTHLRIENAGGPGGANAISCRNGGNPLSAAIKLVPIVTAAYAGPPIDEVEIVRSGGDGLAFMCVAAGCLTTDYATELTGSNNTGTLLRPLGCPP